MDREAKEPTRSVHHQDAGSVRREISQSEKFDGVSLEQNSSAFGLI
jgi:hypothetical protein